MIETQSARVAQTQEGSHDIKKAFAFAFACFSSSNEPLSLSLHGNFSPVFGFGFSDLLHQFQSARP